MHIQPLDPNGDTCGIVHELYIVYESQWKTNGLNLFRFFVVVLNNVQSDDDGAHQLLHCIMSNSQLIPTIGTYLIVIQGRRSNFGGSHD